MNPDQITGWARKAIDTLFVSNPKGTSLGVLIGIVLHGIIQLFHPILLSIQSINILAIKVWHLIALSIFSINLPIYLKRKSIDQSITNAIKFIEEGKANSTISEEHSKIMYVRLYDKVLENVTFEVDNSKEINQEAKPKKEPLTEDEI